MGNAVSTEDLPSKRTLSQRPDPCSILVFIFAPWWLGHGMAWESYSPFTVPSHAVENYQHVVSSLEG